MVDLDKLGLRRPYARVASNDDIHARTHGSIELNPVNSSYEYLQVPTNDSNISVHSTTQSLQKSFATQKSDPSRYSGWRKGALLAACLASFTLILNLGFTVWFATIKPNADGLTALYTGSCQEVQKLDLWVHLGINALSTLLLGASNYCMQCLTAPNRREIDRAHQQGQWLDVGVASFRNLRSVAKRKMVMWWLLALSSIPLHLLYNSAFYSSNYNNEYQITWVNNDFLTGAPYNETALNTWDPIMPWIDLRPVQQNSSDWERLENEQCIEAYAVDWLTDYRNIVLVSSNKTSSVNALACFDTDCGSVLDATYTRSAGYAFDWICDDLRMDEYIGKPYNGICFEYVDQVKAHASTWAPLGYNIEYCLAQKAPKLCSFNGNTPIIAIVAGCNLLKTIIMFVVAFRLRGKPFLVVGDAIESFLRIPDGTTQGLCLLSRRDVLKKKIWPAAATMGDFAPAMTADLPSKRMYHAASRKAWVVSITYILIALGVVLGLFGYVLKLLHLSSSPGFNATLVSSMWLFGFGVVSPFTIISGDAWSVQHLKSVQSQVLAAVVIANLPQAVFSLFCLLINRILTSMFLADEWNDFVEHRKGLRVSNPVEGSHQRSTYFIQLPYKIGLPLMVISALIHWLLSQSLFLAVVREYDPFGNPVGMEELERPIASCAFSPISFLFILIAIGVVILTILVISLHRLRPGIPMVGSCSVAIAAACHAPSWDEDVANKEVQWGVLPASETGIQPGHCCFSSSHVDPVSSGKEYA